MGPVMDELRDLIIEVAPAIVVEVAYNAIDLVARVVEWISEQLGYYTYN